MPVGKSMENPLQGYVIRAFPPFFQRMNSVQPQNKLLHPQT